MEKKNCNAFHNIIFHIVSFEALGSRSPIALKLEVPRALTSFVFVQIYDWKSSFVWIDLSRFQKYFIPFLNLFCMEVVRYLDKDVYANFSRKWNGILFKFLPFSYLHLFLLSPHFLFSFISFISYLHAQVCGTYLKFHLVLFSSSSVFCCEVFQVFPISKSRRCNWI